MWLAIAAPNLTSALLPNSLEFQWAVKGRHLTVFPLGLVQNDPSFVESFYVQIKLTFAVFLFMFKTELLR